MLVEIPGSNNCYLDTEKGTRLIKGPTTGMMWEVFHSQDRDELTMIEFESLNKRYAIMQFCLEPHPHVDGGWWITGILQRTRKVAVLWIPNHPGEGCLWQNPSPVQEARRKAPRFKPKFAR